MRLEGKEYWRAREEWVNINLSREILEFLAEYI